MLCEKCGKKAATVAFTDIQDGQLTQYRLCKDCAQSMGISESASCGEFAISNLLSGMLDEVSATEDADAKSVCGTCGMEYSDFKDTGRLGCPDCYESFSASLRHLLRRIHGSNQHEGKVPVSEMKAVAGKREVRRLKDLLQKAVEAEEFERAAEIRDQLREMETGTTSTDTEAKRKR
jgi:protein arginine kinase activator